MKNRPRYAVASVDSALHLAQLLVMEGPLGVTEAAERLGVSVSTAHRLLATLVYRDFAEQMPDRRYCAGSVLRLAPVPDVPMGELRSAAARPLRHLVEQVHESANLLVLSGTSVRFVSTVECDQPIRAGDRAGKALPAHLTSAGRAMLAELDRDRLPEFLGSLPEEEQARQRRALAAVRRNGFALNNQLTEAGLTAVGVAVHRASAPVAGISVAMPSARFSRERLPGLVRALRECRDAIEEVWVEPPST